MHPGESPGIEESGGCKAVLDRPAAVELEALDLFTHGSGDGGETGPDSIIGHGVTEKAHGGPAEEVRAFARLLDVPFQFAGSPDFRDGWGSGFHGIQKLRNEARKKDQAAHAAKQVRAG